MKASTTLNILNEYTIYKNQSLGKGATGEVYLGINAITKANH